MKNIEILWNNQLHLFYVAQPNRWQMTLIPIPTLTNSILRILRTVWNSLAHQRLSTGNNICRSKVRGQEYASAAGTSCMNIWRITLHPGSSPCNIFSFCKLQNPNLVHIPWSGFHYLYGKSNFKYCRLWC